VTGRRVRLFGRNPHRGAADRTDRPDADVIVMPGGNWPAMSVVERLERELGKPVLANNAVSLWAALRLLKRPDSIPGYGRLLRNELPD